MFYRSLSSFSSLTFFRYFSHLTKRSATSTLFFVLKKCCFLYWFCTDTAVKIVLISAFVKRCYRIFSVFLVNLLRFSLLSCPFFTALYSSVSTSSANVVNGTDFLPIVKYLLYSQTFIVNKSRCSVLYCKPFSLGSSDSTPPVILCRKDMFIWSWFSVLQF